MNERETERTMERMTVRRGQDAPGAAFERPSEGSGSEPGPDARRLALDPESVLSVLEADQLVAAKERAHFGPATLSSGVRLLFWALRVYVFAMLALVVVQVVRALHGAR